MKSVLATIVASLVGLSACTAVSAQAGGPVTDPSEHLGRPLGVDFDLADWDEVSSYYKLLAQQSPNVLTERIGTSTEGREFLLSIISRP